MSAVTGFGPIGVTADRLIRDVFNRVRSEDAVQMNRLLAGIDDITGQVTYDFEDIPILSGRTIEIDDEVMYVWSANSLAKALTVERGWQQTNPLPHTAGTIIKIEPRFTRNQILDALRDEIEGWPAQLYAVVTWTGTPPSLNSTLIPLTEIDGYTGLRLLDVQIDRADYSDYGLVLSTPLRRPTLAGARLEQTIGSSGYPDGYGLRFDNHQWRSTATVSVVLGVHFQTDLLGPSVDVGTLGLTRSMCDIAAIGAAVRLLFPVEADRTDATALTRARVATDVPPNAASQTAQAMLAWRDRRISEECLRLLSDYGWTKR